MSRASGSVASEFDCCALIPGLDAVEVQGHAPLRSGGRASEGRESGCTLLGLMSRSQIEMLVFALSKMHAERGFALIASRVRVAAVFHVLLKMDGMALATRPEFLLRHEARLPRRCNHHDWGAQLPLSQNTPIRCVC
jgi:hypothetical protein